MTDPRQEVGQRLPTLNAAQLKPRPYGEHSRRKLFDHFQLTKDRETAKYLPYDSVAFPRLRGAEDGRELGSELENLWLVGFLDQEKQAEKETVLREMSHFVSLPGGALMPGAASELRRLYGKERRAKMTASKRFDDMTPGQARRVLGSSVTAPRLSDALVLRLRELATTKGAGHARALVPRRSSAAKGEVSGAQRRAGRSPFAIYERENAKLRRTIRERRPARHSVAVKSRAMEDLYELEREQTSAAVVIQGSYRRYRRLVAWQTYLIKTKAATKIQRYARGMVSRAMTIRWHMRRTWLVIVTQSIARGVIDRKRWSFVCRVETKAAIQCQRCIRGFLARLLARQLTEHRSATLIQALWRGCCGRSLADRRWLDGELTKMQALARGHLGRKHFKELSRAMVRAAVNIQRYSRGMRVRQRRGFALWQREMERRRDFLKILRVEDEWHCEELARMRKRLARRKLGEKINEASKRLKQMREEVRRLEWDYLSLRNERAQVSPRAVAQGWTDQLDANAKEHRKWVTNAKLEAVFTTAVYLRQREAELNAAELEMSDFEWELERIKERRKSELEALWARESERKWRGEHREQQRRIADQRRRWRVTWYTKEGKPDKRRRPGYEWAPTVFAGQERDGFFIGGLDILAAGKEPPPRLGTNEGLELVQQQVALQNARNQMQQYSALLRPVFEGVADSMLDVQLRGYPPKKIVAEGFGPTIGYDATLGDDGGDVLDARPITPLGPPGNGRQPFASQIPWALLDDLEAEKTRLAEVGKIAAPKFAKSNSPPQGRK